MQQNTQSERSRSFSACWYVVYSCFLLFLLYRPVNAEDQECIEDRCFTKTSTLNDRLSLHGLATFRYWGFVVYRAGLYLPGDFKGKNAIVASQKQLDIVYEREFTAKDFQVSGLEILEAHPEVDTAQYADCLKQIDALYQAVQPGDRYSIVQSEAGSLSLYLNFRKVGTVCDKDFAEVYFAIWLSREHSIGSRFQSKLLGQLSDTTEYCCAK